MEQSDEIKKLQEQIAAVSGKGSAYFLEMKLDDAKKNETFREMEGIIARVNDRLMSCADDRRLLKSDLAQIIFNGSYLVNAEKSTSFESAVGDLKQAYQREYGLTIHMSGPWAAYSFC
jgi:gas vesicle protein GvpL/GvpF